MSDPRMIQDSMLGRKFAELRHRRDLSQEDVARKAGVGRNTIYRLEKGLSVRYELLEVIAVALEARIDFTLTDSVACDLHQRL